MDAQDRQDGAQIYLGFLIVGIFHANLLLRESTP